MLAAAWRGRSCHAANAGSVEHANALLIAARDLAGLDPVIGVGAPHPRLGRTTVVATQLSAGERHNVVPDIANAVFDAVGVRVDEIPVTPDKVLEALERRDPPAARKAMRSHMRQTAADTRLYFRRGDDRVAIA